MSFLRIAFCDDSKHAPRPRKLSVYTNPEGNDFKFVSAGANVDKSACIETPKTYFVSGFIFCDSEKIKIVSSEASYKLSEHIDSCCRIRRSGSLILNVSATFSSS